MRHKVEIQMNGFETVKLIRGCSGEYRDVRIAFQLEQAGLFDAEFATGRWLLPVLPAVACSNRFTIIADGAEKLPSFLVLA